MKCLLENLEVNYPCSAVCPLYGDCMTAFLQERRRRVRTNADRIRSMTDEEMAEMFSGLEDNISDCVSAWLDWLKQPAEED